MSIANNLVFYIVVFLVIAALTVILIALVNIFTKSFKPKNSAILLVVLMVCFLVSSTLTLINLRRALNSFELPNSTTPTTVPNTNNSADDLIF